jgi:hypothetical protein
VGSLKLGSPCSSNPSPFMVSGRAGWNRWQKWASEQVGLPKSHLVKAARGMLEEGADMADFRTASSIAMVGLLARWASCQALGGAHND